METPSERKARLKALRDSQVSGEPADDGQAPSELQEAERTPAATAQAPEEPVLRFRNYNVKDAERIEHEQVQAAHPPKAEVPKAEQPTEENEDPEVSTSQAPEEGSASAGGLLLHTMGPTKPGGLPFMHSIILTAVVVAPEICKCSSTFQKSLLQQLADSSPYLLGCRKCWPGLRLRRRIGTCAVMWLPS